MAHQNESPVKCWKVEDVNENQKHLLVKKVKRHYGDDLTGRTFAVWGSPSSRIPTTCAKRGAGDCDELLAAEPRYRPTTPCYRRSHAPLWQRAGLSYAKGNYEAWKARTACCSLPSGGSSAIPTSSASARLWWNGHL
jgi:UDPglucose 6-dehydrogenase